MLQDGQEVLPLLVFPFVLGPVNMPASYTKTWPVFSFVCKVGWHIRFEKNCGGKVICHSVVTCCNREIEHEVSACVRHSCVQLIDGLPGAHASASRQQQSSGSYLRSHVSNNWHWFFLPQSLCLNPSVILFSFRKQRTPTIMNTLTMRTWMASLTNQPAIQRSQKKSR